MNQRPDRGRVVRARELIADALEQLRPNSPARAPVLELSELFSEPIQDIREIRELLERVPGGSFAKKGERIGVGKGALWAIWHGKYRPSAKVLARIEAAAGIVNKEHFDDN